MGTQNVPNLICEGVQFEKKSKIIKLGQNVGLVELFIWKKNTLNSIKFFFYAIIFLGYSNNKI